MSGANLRLRRVWRVNHLHVPARAPRTAERARRIPASWEEPPLLFSALGGLRLFLGAPFRPFGGGGNLQPTLARGFCSPLRCVGMGLMDRLGDLADVAGRLPFRLDGMGINLAPIAQWALPLRLL